MDTRLLPARQSTMQNKNVQEPLFFTALAALFFLTNCFCQAQAAVKKPANTKTSPKTLHHTRLITSPKEDNYEPPACFKESRWQRDKYPLKVYFAPVEKGDRHFKATYPGIMREAFQQWSKETKGFADFRIVTGKPYDIEVRYVNQIPHYKRGVAHLTEVGGYTRYATIDLAPRNDDPKELVLRVAEHEIGHVIGLKHGEHRGVMHRKAPEIELLSSEDVDDVRRIYKLDENFRPLRASAEKLDDYRLKLMQILNHPTGELFESSGECLFSFEVDAAGHIFNHIADPNSSVSKQVLMRIAKSDPLPAAPTDFEERLRVTGSVSSEGIFMVKTFDYIMKSEYTKVSTLVGRLSR